MEFALAIFLFVVYFCVFCWLFHKPQQPSLNTAESIIKKTACAEPEQTFYEKVAPANEEDSLYCYLQEHLTMPRLRKLAGILKSENVIAKHERTTGKGVTQKTLTHLICSRIPQHREVVVSAILNQIDTFAEIV
jgi:hypothetical protein